MVPHKEGPGGSGGESAVCPWQRQVHKTRGRHVTAESEQELSDGSKVHPQPRVVWEFHQTRLCSHLPAVHSCLGNSTEPEPMIPNAEEQRAVIIWLPVY